MPTPTNMYAIQRNMYNYDFKKEKYITALYKEAVKLKILKMCLIAHYLEPREIAVYPGNM